MARKSSTGGPDREEREARGDSAANPSGISSKKPAEGADDTPPKLPGSPKA